MVRGGNTSSRLSGISTLILDGAAMPSPEIKPLKLHGGTREERREGSGGMEVCGGVVG